MRAKAVPVTSFRAHKPPTSSSVASKAGATQSKGARSETSCMSSCTIAYQEYQEPSLHLVRPNPH